jgi:hypothetical protein
LIIAEYVTSHNQSGKIRGNQFGKAMRAKPAAGPWIGVAFGVAVALAVAVLAVAGSDPSGIGMALRVTARWSFLLFWMAYAGGATAALFGPALAPLAHRGREFGLAFAAAHLVHLGLVVWLYRVSGRVPLSGSMFVFVFFTIGIVWTYLLAALSFGGLSRALGPRPWRLLRFLGMNYILLAFARDFVPPVIHSGIVHQEFWQSVSYAPFAAMSVAAPLLCLAAAGHRRWGMWHATA